MKYHAKFQGPGGERTRQVEVREDSSGVEVVLDGRAARYDVSATPEGGLSIISSDGGHAEVVARAGADGDYRAHVGHTVLTFELLDDLTARALSAAGRRATRSAGDLKAAIPGRVLRILVGPGDRVSAGQPLVVLEAMKMENDVKAPRDATLKSVEVAAGQAVGSGQVLVRFEPEG